MLLVVGERGGQPNLPSWFRRSAQRADRSRHPVRYAARDGLSVAAVSLGCSLALTVACWALRAVDRMTERPRHDPVMLTEIVAVLAPALQPAAGADAPVLVDCTLGLGGHAEALLTACPQARLIGLDRDPAALRLAGERLAPFARSDRSGRSGLRRTPRRARSTGSTEGAGRAARPRAVLDADRRPRPRLRVRARCAAGHADGSHGADRRRDPQHLLPDRPGPDPAPLRRGAVRRPDRRPDRRRAGPRTVHPLRPGWSRCSTTPSPPRSARPAGIRPSARSRPCGSR